MRSWAAALALCCGCVASPHPAVTGTIVEETLTTQVGALQLFVRLPPEYERDVGRRFPVIVQLDATFSGLAQHQVTSGFQSELEAARKAEPAIVVGLAYPTPDTPPEGRFRDYTFPNRRFAPSAASKALYGFGAEAFYAAVRDELIPHLDATYRTDGKARTLVGHSLGGAFVLFALFHFDAGANAHFDKFIAASPSYPLEEGALFGEEEAARTRLHFLPVTLFLGMGELEGPAMNVYHREMARRLGGYSALRFEAKQFAGADHLGNIAATYAPGLKFVEAR